jgi:endonuclease-3
LPGVGTKTANVVLNVAFGEPTIAVDTHIFRVSHRLGLAKAKTPDALSVKLEKLTPDEFRLHAHHWLILHGRYICKARKPECWRCPLIDLCAFKPKTPDPGSGVLGLPRSKAADQKPRSASRKSAARKRPARATNKPGRRPH